MLNINQFHKVRNHIPPHTPHMVDMSPPMPHNNQMLDHHNMDKHNNYKSHNSQLNNNQSQIHHTELNRPVPTSHNHKTMSNQFLENHINQHHLKPLVNNNQRNLLSVLSKRRRSLQIKLISYTQKTSLLWLLRKFNK